MHFSMKKKRKEVSSVFVCFFYEICPIRITLKDDFEDKLSSAFLAPTGDLNAFFNEEQKRGRIIVCFFFK